jgi:hypothetical protein
MTVATLDILWQFARGDLPAEEFQTWFYDTADVEHILGKTAYLNLLEFDFRDRPEAAEARAHLRDILRTLPAMPCQCMEWRDSEKLPIGFETDVKWFDSRFEVICRRTPWLESVRCRTCSQCWYVGTDTIDDDYYVQRISCDVAERTRNDVWPPYFEEVKTFWPTEEWLQHYGYASLKEWQRKNSDA